MKNAVIFNFSLDTTMKKEKETMRTTVTNILEKVPNIKKSIADIKSTNESLVVKEEDLDDAINDKFDQLVAMIEQRRTCLLNQLHFRVSSKTEKLGKP
jgi:predicted transcriptional regulator